MSTPKLIQFINKKIELIQNYVIKTEKRTISPNQTLESLQLLSQNTINQHRKKLQLYSCNTSTSSN